MKPTKNRVYCNACTKPKMLFETKAEAERYLEYNAEDILLNHGYAPVRVYYCKACGGWHVTSKVSHATSKLEQMDRHMARLKKYASKNAPRQARMEYIKAYQILSEALRIEGENLRKSEAVDTLIHYHQWINQQLAA